MHFLLDSNDTRIIKVIKDDIERSKTLEDLY